jgi:hypothetical protein
MIINTTLTVYHASYTVIEAIRKTVWHPFMLAGLVPFIVLSLAFYAHLPPAGVSAL